MKYKRVAILEKVAWARGESLRDAKTSREQSSKGDVTVALGETIFKVCKALKSQPGRNRSVNGKRATESRKGFEILKGAKL